MAVSFARFVPQLPMAPSRARFALTWPRDGWALACLLVAAALAIWALLDGRREYQSSRPRHLGLRVVLDLSASMGVRDAGATRLAQALARLDEARRQVAGAGPKSACLELVAVGAEPGAVQALPLAGDLPAPLAGGLRHEGAEVGSLVAAAMLPQVDCVLTHVLVLTDMPPVAMTAGEGVDVIWDQVGAPVGNAGIRQLQVMQSAFGQTTSEIRVEGVVSGQDLPDALVLDGPSGQQQLSIHPMPEAEGRWFATAAYAGPGEYAARLAAADGYDGDDKVVARLQRPASLAVDWRLSDLARPAGLAQGGPGDLLVAEGDGLPADALARPAGLAQGGPGDLLVAEGDGLPADALARPVLLTYPGFGLGRQPGHIGPFIEDAALLSLVSFDALEAAMPAAWPGPLPPGFAPALVDDAGGVLVARREQPKGLIVPAPVPGLPDPARSLSLTLFFSALADLAMPEAQQQALEWRDGRGGIVANAWRESMTGRPLGPPADLHRLAQLSRVSTGAPFWPWLVLASLLALLAERLLRLARRSEAVS
ncbi:hypothetical protein BDD41_2096 [Paracoccus versutus]|uniref:Uncharacterized protein n=2 Tax=Paracoccus versutus TaxID=34007 RepID=A0A3D9XUZ0_PARVE|nr:hypothetical protein BDD41_2096 [Paracoccus versutus]